MASIITLSIVGLLVGFIFSMPIAGPISILITTNALKGRVRFCNLAAIGASVADFIYVFCAVLGLTKFYSFFRPAMPYVLFGGMIFLVILGFRITKTKIEQVKEQKEKPAENKRSAFLTGFLLNFLNPTLFISWLTSSFIVITLVTSLGFSTGGLDQRVNASFSTMNSRGKDSVLRRRLAYFHLDSTRKKNEQDEKLQANKYFTFLANLLYSFFLSLGGVIWFFCLAGLLARHRHRVKTKFINLIIRSLGWALYLFAAFLAYQGVTMLMLAHHGG